MIGLILKGFGWLRGFWASRHASNILLAVAIGLAGIHYANLKASAARCKAATEYAAALKKLSAQIVEHRNDERDEANEAIDQANDPCLDADVADLLRQNPD